MARQTSYIPQGVAITFGGVLTADVGRPVREWDDGANAGHVNDTTVALLQQRQEGIGNVNHPEYVHFIHLSEVILGQHLAR